MNETAQRIRAQCLAARRGLTEDMRRTYSLGICQRLTDLPVLRDAEVIFSYQACRDEADLTAFHDRARALGKTLAFPWTGQNGAMEALVPLSGKAWVLDRFGIRAPLPERSRRLDPGEIDAVLTPCVGFDGRGNRLGHGAGFYDRFFPRCPQAVRITVGFEAQRCSGLRPEPWDVPMEYLVTEVGVWTFP